MIKNRYIVLFAAIIGVPFHSCLQFDSTLVFSGSNPTMVEKVDTSLLYSELKNYCQKSWRIFSIPAPGVPMDCFIIQTNSAPSVTASSRIILFFSGNDVSFWYNYGEWKCLSSLDADFMTIDLRGYGRSLGKFTTTEQSCYEDAERAIRFLIDSAGYYEDSISLFGFSLGTGIVIQLAKQHKTSHTVLFSPLASISTASNGITGGFNIPSGWLVKSSFNNIAKISEIKQPLYILAGENDMLFPPKEHAIKLFNKAREPKHLMIVPELGHIMFVTESYDYWKDSISVFLGK